MSTEYKGAGGIDTVPSRLRYLYKSVDGTDISSIVTQEARELRGITFYGIIKEQVQRRCLFEKRDPRERALMAAVDRINEQMGRRTVELAGSGIERPWAMERRLKSPCYTTRWGELAEAE